MKKWLMILSLVALFPVKSGAEIFCLDSTNGWFWSAKSKTCDQLVKYHKFQDTMGSHFEVQLDSPNYCAFEDVIQGTFVNCQMNVDRNDIRRIYEADDSLHYSRKLKELVYGEKQAQAPAAEMTPADWKAEVDSINDASAAQ